MAEEKINLDDAVQGTLGGYVLVKSKNPLLGITDLYHGTTPEAAKSIKKTGLLSGYSNSPTGATKWLSEFITDQTIKELSSLSSLSETQRYRLKKDIEKEVAKITGWTDKKVFATQRKGHGKIYSLFSDKQNFRNYIEDIKKIVDQDIPDKELQKKMIGRLVELGWDSKFNNPGKVVKFQIPTVKYDKEWVVDTVKPPSEKLKQMFENPKNLKEKLIKYVMKGFQTAKEGDVEPKYFKTIKGPGFYAETLSHFPEYVKTHPVRFGLGLGGTAAGVALAYEPTEKLVNYTSDKVKSWT